MINYVRTLIINIMESENSKDWLEEKLERELW